MAVRDGTRRFARFQVGDDMVNVVFEADTWWSWQDQKGREITNAGRHDIGHGIGPVEAVLAGPGLIPHLDLEVRGNGVVAGRPSYLVHARPRMTEIHGLSPLHHLGTGADEYELGVDCERGTILRAVASRDRQRFRVIEIAEIEYDAQLPDGRFALPPDRAFTPVPDPGRPGLRRRPRWRSK